VEIRSPGEFVRLLRIVRDNLKEAALLAALAGRIDLLPRSRTLIR